MDRKEFKSFLDLTGPIKTLMSLRTLLTEGMQAIVDLAKKFGIERICIFLKDENEQMTLVCGHPAEKHGIRSKKKLQEHAGLKQILQNKSMLLIKNPGEDPRSACTPEFCKENQINASLFIRLEINHRPIGAIIIDAVGKKKKFTKYDIMMAKKIALLATKEIHNRKKIEAGAEQKIMWLTSAAVAHEIRNPLTSLGVAGRRIKAESQKGNSDSDMEKIKRYAKIITDETQRIENLIKNVVELLGQKTPNFNKNNLNKLAEEIIDQIQKTTSKINIHMQKGKIPPVYMDVEQIKLALNQILKNAIDETRGTKEEIFVRTWKQSHFVCAEIANTGSYIKKEEIEKIFNPFYTKKRKDGGMGLGLAIAKHIMESHGGYIEVMSRQEPQPLTSFTCFFPVKKKSAN